MARKPRQRKRPLKSAPGQGTLPATVPLKDHERRIALRDLRLRITADLLATADIGDEMRRLLQTIFGFPAERARSDRIYQCSLRQIAGKLGWDFSRKRRRLQELIDRAVCEGLLVRELSFAQDGTQAGNKYRIRCGQLRRRGRVAAPLPAPPAPATSAAALETGPRPAPEGGGAAYGPVRAPPPRGRPEKPCAPGAHHGSMGFKEISLNPMDPWAPPNGARDPARCRFRDELARADLDNPRHVEWLWRIAIAAGWLEDCEANRQRFFASAWQSRGADNRRAAFTARIKTRRWHTLTNAADDWARHAIAAVDFPTLNPQPSTGPAPQPDPEAAAAEDRHRQTRALAAWAANRSTEPRHGTH